MSASSQMPMEVRRQGTAPATRISLLEGVRSGDDGEAWRAFVDLYTPLVFGYCRQRGMQESDARDVTQNVFFAVSRAMRSFVYDPGRGRFRSWLGTITCREIRRYQKWVGHLRQPAGELIAQPNHSPTCELESEWETEFTAFLFRRAVALVRPHFADDVWQAFERTWLADEPPAEVARQLNRPVAWVYKAKFRVLQQLRGQVTTLADDIPLKPR